MEFEGKNPDEIIQSIKDKFKFNKGQKLPLVLIIGIVVLIMLGKGMFYTIQPDEVGVLLRFGKLVDTTKPGLHFKAPFGIDKVIPVKVEKIYTSEFGFKTKSAGVRTIYSQKSYQAESLMLTGDLNVLDLEWIVQFKINDPYSVLFHIRNIDKTIRDIAESVMRKIVGDYAFSEILTTKRIEINIKAQEEMQKILNSYGAGIQIVKIKLQDVNPPDKVKPAFNEVNQAKQEREELKNKAWKVYNQKIPQAKGEASKVIQEAQGYALEKVNMAKGDVKRFNLIRNEYAHAKEITIKRLYLEYMNEILPKVGKKYIIDSKEKGILPLLKLDQK